MRRIGIPAVVVLCLLLAAAGGAPGDTPGDLLFQAVRANDLQYLKAQLAKSADPNTRGRRDMTLLMYAAAFGSPEAVQLLLDSGADVNAKNSLDATALIWAAADSQKLRLLLDRGADVNARTKLGRTPLMVAAACDGCADIVRLLLAKGADAKATDVVGNTPLSLAAAAGDVEIMRLLVAQGAAADSATNGGLTPLMSAIANCNLAAVQLLLSRGARVNSALTDAGKVKFGPIALVGSTPLITAAPYCQTDLVKALLDAGADVKARDIRNMTPLMLAVASETQDVAVVRLLLQAGSDVNVKSKAGETARDWAGKYGNRDVIAALSPQAVSDPPRLPGLPILQPKARLPAVVRGSIQSATALLERSANEFFKQSGCVGCHHQPMAVLAISAARSAGLPVDEPSAQGLVKMIESDLTGSQETLPQRFDPGGLADGEGYVLQALAAARYPAGAITDTVARHIAALQHRQGNWHVGDASRSPIQEGDIARTARSLHALQQYGPPALKPEFEKRIGRARDWLFEAKPATNDDRAMQLAGLYWAGGGRDKLRSLGDALIATQRGDGGWSQNPNLASDAFASGESLWALQEAGVLKPSEPVYQRGVEYLVTTQREGSWHVRSRAPKFQPYFQSGFPYEHDQWVSSAATAWAVMALAPALEKR
jgi:ankyrin repeat protein